MQPLRSPALHVVVTTTLSPHELETEVKSVLDTWKPSKAFCPVYMGQTFSKNKASEIQETTRESENIYFLTIVIAVLFRQQFLFISYFDCVSSFALVN
jgi:hypothetical protein